MAMKIEVKEERLTDNEEEMEVLRLLKTNSALGLPPQEVPVDLTTGDRICHTSLLQHMPYPHLRFHSKCLQQKQEKDLLPVKCEKNTVDTTRNLKENKSFDKVKKEPNSMTEIKGQSKKRRIEDDQPKSEIQPTKRQKTEQEYPKYDFKQGFPFTNHLENEIKNEKDMKYVSLKTIPNHYLPFNFMEQASLLERIKSSKTLDASPSSIKEIESLLAAVQQSQMLYYSYCTKLLQNLQARRIIEEQEHLKKTFKGYSSYQLEATNEREPKEKNASGKPEQEKEFVGSAGQQKTITHSNSVPYQEKTSPSSTCSSSAQASLRSSLSSPSPSSTTGDEKGRDSSSTPKANTTNGTPGRKRAPRALTGKHVRPGTGASPSTLRTLRQKLEERQMRRISHSFSVKGEEGKSQGEK